VIPKKFCIVVFRSHAAKKITLGGFYKRGCQVKTRYPSQGGFVFLGIQPLPASPT
jgi:hypothetical protein